MLMHEGRIAAIGVPEDVITPEHLRTVYGAEVRVERICVGGVWRTVCIPLLREARAAGG
jgi:ABC-type hemin transport system ATPase subunit